MPRTALLVVAAASLVAGCTAGASSAAPTVTVTSMVTTTAVVTETVTPAVTVTSVWTPTPSPDSFPKGYPKKVGIRTLPSHMRSHVTDQGLSEAVAIAPGVWTALSPGTTILEAATYGSRFGFCASIAAYEAKYTVESVGNSCW